VRKRWWQSPTQVPRRPSTANQPLRPLVDQDRGDGGRARRPQPATGRAIPGRQFLELLLTRRGSEQQAQFLLPFSKTFRRSHRSPSSNRLTFCAPSGETGRGAGVTCAKPPCPIRQQFWGTCSTCPTLAWHVEHVPHRPGQPKRVRAFSNAGRWNRRCSRPGCRRNRFGCRRGPRAAAPH
jgi:hypothetical protein